MIRIDYLNNMRFIGKSKSGHSVVMDTSQKVGGEETAPTPMEYIILGLGGCTGMDVISILKKMKQDITVFSIDIDYENADDYPKVYTKIHIIYHITGHNLVEDKVKRAIVLSQDKYCSVSAMLKETAELSWELDMREANNEA